jgi:hypothetical protein
MKQFKFTTDEPLDVPSATLSTSRWMKRRAYPIQLVSVTPYEVIVELDAPDNAHHNRAVNALGKILSRQLDRLHSVQSRLRTTFAVA